MRAELAEVARALSAVRPWLAAGDGAALGAALRQLAEARAGDRLIAALRRDQRRLERTMERRMRQLLDQLGRHVAAVAAEVGGLVVEATEPTDPERERVDRIVAAATLQDWARSQLAPAYEAHWLQVAEVTAQTLGTLLRPLTRGPGLALLDPATGGFDWQVRDPVAGRLLAQGGRRAGLVDLAADTRRSLLRVVGQSKEEGLNPRQTARLIRDEVPAGRFVHAGPKYRAELIARTETLHAQRASTLELYRDSGVVTQVVAHDGDSDPHCAARDGQRFALDDAAAEMVSDTVHPNCVLAFAPAID